MTAAATVANRGSTGASYDAGDALLDRVLAALTEGMTAPNGEPFEVDTACDPRVGEVVATYRLGTTVLAVRRLRVAERSRTVSLLDVELPTWWFDGTSIHERLVTNLGAGAGPGCLLSAVLTGPRTRAWTPYFDWARGMANANAAAVAAAVEAVTPPPSADDGTDDAVWGGSDLPVRVRSLAGGSWLHLIRSTTPAELVARLDDLHPGLADPVFAHVGAWYGERLVPQTALGELAPVTT